MNALFLPSNRARRGAMLPLIAILLPALLIFLGFAVDLAYMQTTRMELQAAADSAARAGATRLSQNDDDVADARNFAIQIAAQNTVAGSPLNLRTSEVRVGRSTRNASGKWTFTNNGRPANAVRVTAQRTRTSAGGAVPLFFGALIGTPSFQPVQRATASFLNVDVCLVLDRSSSMKKGLDEDGNMPTNDPRCCRAPDARSRWMILDGAVRIFIEELTNTDADERVALATYSSDLSQLRPPLCGASSLASTLDRRLDSNLTSITQQIDRLSSSVWNGNTYIEAGMRTGLAALLDARYNRASAEKVMILLTDGNENVGSAMDAADDCAAAGVTVHTITFSNSANQATMRDVAEACGGQHFHAASAASLRSVFRNLAAQTAQLTE